MGDSCGWVEGLFVKPKCGLPMAKREEIALKVGRGIEGDVNSHPISPRQVLVVRFEDLQGLAIPAGELRENIVISGVDATTLAPGAAIATSSGAAIRLTFYCEPCKRIAPWVESWKSIKGKRGILGVAIANATVRVGDRLKVIPNAFPALPEVPYERFLHFIARIPAGKVVSYTQAIVGMGVDKSYFRAIPKYLEKAAVAGYPAHRVVDSQGNLSRFVGEQREKLEQENVLVVERSVSLADYFWEDPTIFLGN